MTWLVIFDTHNTPHVVPLNDQRGHEASEVCWCAPMGERRKMTPNDLSELLNLFGWSPRQFAALFGLDYHGVRLMLQGRNAVPARVAEPLGHWLACARAWPVPERDGVVGGVEG